MTLLDLAQRFVGEVRERPGAADDPFILWCLESTPLAGELHDEIPWCSAFVNRLAWMLRLPRSKSAMARSWLDVGVAVGRGEPGNDVVVFSRGSNPSQGHVGVFAGYDYEDSGRGPGLPTTWVRVVGGNQGNAVSMGRFPLDRVLGIRRL